MNLAGSIKEDTKAQTVDMPVARPSVPLPAPVSRGRDLPASRDATEQEVVEILASAARLITHSAGEIPATPAQQEKAAYLHGGVFLLDRMDPLNKHAVELRMKVIRSGKSIVRQFKVDRSVLKTIYDVQNKKVARAGSAVSLESTQRKVLEMIADGAKVRASDVFVTFDNTLEDTPAVVSIRVDGVLCRLGTITAREADALFHAAHTMTDASDTTYKPQEYQGARISKITQPNLPENVVSVRLQFNPLMNQGRAMIARILYETSLQDHADIDSLGYSKEQVETIKEMRRRPHGAIIISGPTGSGKSTTLQLCLSAYLREVKYEKLVGTIEDPPEYIIPGAMQLPVLNALDEEDRVRKFQAALYALLRSNPDHIMVGEIRDKASGRIAMRAALDGHLLWTTIHSNDAVSIPLGLRERGVEDFYIYDASIIVGLIAQRLVRKLCPHCKIPFAEYERRHANIVNPAMFAILREIAGPRVNDIYFASDDGCGHCNHRGYKGRCATAEVVRPDQTFFDLLRNNGRAAAINHWLENCNGLLMLEHGVQKIMRGEVDAREIEDRIGPLKEFRLDRREHVIGMV